MIESMRFLLVSHICNTDIFKGKIYLVYFHRLLWSYRTWQYCKGNYFSTLYILKFLVLPAIYEKVQIDILKMLNQGLTASHLYL